MSTMVRTLESHATLSTLTPLLDKELKDLEDWYMKEVKITTEKCQRRLSLDDIKILDRGWDLIKNVECIENLKDIYDAKLDSIKNFLLTLSKEVELARPSTAEEEVDTINSWYTKHKKQTAANQKQLQVKVIWTNKDKRLRRTFCIILG